MSGLRIHFFTSYVHEQGTYFRYHNLATALARLGQSVTVFGCDVSIGARNRTEERDGVQYEIVKESWKSSVFSQFNHPVTTVRRAARSYPGCDVAHLFQPFLGAAVAWRRSPAGIKCYDWDDQWTGGLYGAKAESWRAVWPRFAVRHLEARLPSMADHVTTVSDYLAEFASRRSAAAVSVLHNGYWPGPVADRAEARARLGLREGALYVGFMGRTLRELEWCFRAVDANLRRFPRLRFALCGPRAEVLDGLGAAVRERVDYLGELPAAATRDFAAAIDMGLLPLEENNFNLSRFPIKFCDHLATGNPLLCSDVGEVGRLARGFPWAIRAGKTESQWMEAFQDAIGRIDGGRVPNVDLRLLEAQLSWDGLGRRLLATYQHAVHANDEVERTPPGRTHSPLDERVHC